MSIWYKRGRRARWYDATGYENIAGPIEISRSKKESDGSYSALIVDFRSFELLYMSCRITSQSYRTKSLALSAAWIERFLANLKREAEGR